MATKKVEEKKTAFFKPSGNAKNQLDGDTDFTFREFNEVVIRLNSQTVLRIVMDYNTGLYGSIYNEIDGTSWDWHAEEDV